MARDFGLMLLSQVADHLHHTRVGCCLCHFAGRAPSSSRRAHLQSDRRTSVSLTQDVPFRCAYQANTMSLIHKRLLAEEVVGSAGYSLSLKSRRDPFFSVPLCFDRAASRSCRRLLVCPVTAASTGSGGGSDRANQRIGRRHLGTASASSSRQRTCFFHRDLADTGYSSTEERRGVVKSQSAVRNCTPAMLKADCMTLGMPCAVLLVAVC